MAKPVTRLECYDVPLQQLDVQLACRCDITQLFLSLLTRLLHIQYISWIVDVMTRFWYYCPVYEVKTLIQYSRTGKILWVISE